MAQAAIVVDNLTKSFGPVRALDDLSLRVERGLTYGLLGPNGSGKTTLIRALVGLVKPNSGHLSILGEQPRSGHVKQRVGYMTQLPALYSELTVEENLDFFARVYGLDRRQRRARLDELLSLTALTGKASAGTATLSGGMLQRLSLACALVHQPELLLLDEPTVGVDPMLRRVFWDHFQDLNRAGVTIIVSSHIMDEASRCDRLGLLHNGRLLAEGGLSELLAAGDAADLEQAFVNLAGGAR